MCAALTHILPNSAHPHTGKGCAACLHLVGAEGRVACSGKKGNGLQALLREVLGTSRCGVLSHAVASAKLFRCPQPTEVLLKGIKQRLTGCVAGARCIVPWCRAFACKSGCSRGSGPRLLQTAFHDC